jgi:hypothetical protein
MSFLKNLFGGAKPDGSALAQSKELKEYAQIALLAEFAPPRALHEAATCRRAGAACCPSPTREQLAHLRETGLAD